VFIIAQSPFGLIAIPHLLSDLQCIQLQKSDILNPKKYRNQERQMLVHGGNEEGNETIRTDSCNADNPGHVWELRNFGGETSLLAQKSTGRSAKPCSRNG